MCGGIGSLNYRFPKASLTEDDPIIHLFKLECQDKEFEGLDCDRGFQKAANESCQTELDNSDMFMLNIEFPNPTNLSGGNV